MSNATNSTETKVQKVIMKIKYVLPFNQANTLYLQHSFFTLAKPYGMWDLSSPIRNWTCDLCIGSTVLTTRHQEVLQHSFISTYHLSTEKPEIRNYQDVHVYIFNPTGISKHKVTSLILKANFYALNHFKLMIKKKILIWVELLIYLTNLMGLKSIIPNEQS